MQQSKIVCLLFSIIACDILSFAWTASVALPIASNETVAEVADGKAKLGERCKLRPDEIEQPDCEEPLKCEPPLYIQDNRFKDFQVPIGAGTCIVKKQVCSPNPCAHGGTCVIVPGYLRKNTWDRNTRLHNCACANGFSGLLCEIPPTTATVIGGETMASGTPMPSLVSLPIGKHVMKNVATDDDDTDEYDEKDYSETVVTKKAEIELTQIFSVVTTTDNDVQLEEDEDSSGDETTGVASAIPTEKGNLENTTAEEVAKIEEEESKESEKETTEATTTVHYFSLLGVPLTVKPSY